MNRGVFITGTDTGVGKTIVTAGLVYLLRKVGFKVCSFKAVASGGLLKDGKLISGDTEFVRTVADLDLEGFSGKVYERDNVRVIEEITGVTVLGVIKQLNNIKSNYDRLKEEFNRKIDYRMIVADE